MAPVYLKFAELPSTHNHAISMIAKTKPQEATVIVAAHQTSGKGRYDRTWSSAPHANALLSCILYPIHLLASQAFYLNIISTLATSYLLEQYQIEDRHIKWPNDVLVGQHKIAGTLIQNQLSGQRITSAVVSIGLNVNQRHWNNGVMATSLSHIKQQDFNISRIIEEWLDLLLAGYEQSYTSEGRMILKANWINQLSGYGEVSKFARKDASTFYGKLIDVEDSGELIIESNGVKTKFHMDEVRYVL